MATRFLACLVLSIILVVPSGCTLVNSTREMTRQSLRMFKPRSSDYRDLTEEEDHEWDWVGDEARGNQTPEKDPDPWWQNWVMSERARSIERNVGIK